MQVIEKYKNVLWEDETRVAVLLGSAGSGKSVSIAQRIIVRAIQETGKFLVLRKYGSTIRNSTWSLVLKIINEEGLNEYFTVNKSTFTIIGPKSEIIFQGLDDVEKIKSISNVKSIWMEESSEFDFEDFNQLNTRLRDKFDDGPLRIYLSFNPISVHHWLKDKIWDTDNNTFIKIKTTYLDNPYLPQEYKDVLESYKDIDENHYKVYALGEWGNLSGKIIYPVSPTIVNEIPKIYDEKWYSIDFGFTHATVLVEFTRIDGIVYIKVLLYESGLTAEDLTNRMKSLKIDNQPDIYCDSARPEIIAHLRRYGFRAKEADKAVFEGILFVKSIWNNLRFIYSKELMMELNHYVWNDTKDTPVKEYDDALDAIRYGLYTRLKGSIYNTKNPIFSGKIGINKIKETRYG